MSGSTLRPDNDANKRLYGKDVTASAIVFDKAVPPPPSAAKLLATLTRSRRKTSLTSRSSELGGLSKPQLEQAALLEGDGLQPVHNSLKTGPAEAAEGRSCPSREIFS